MSGPLEAFTTHRRLLIGVAYRVLGSAADAEDMVQEAWLRWSKVDHETIEEPRAFLITMVSRLAIDRLRQVKARRETYVGPWLPEPISSDRLERTDNADLAMLIVLETLSPLERAVFVLREAFDLPFAEIATIIGREEATTRQLAKRAAAVLVWIGDRVVTAASFDIDAAGLIRAVYLTANPEKLTGIGGN